jgi:hypothetical protein
MTIALAIALVPFAIALVALAIALVALAIAGAIRHGRSSQSTENSERQKNAAKHDEVLAEIRVGPGARPAIAFQAGCGRRLNNRRRLSAARTATPNIR